MNSAAIICIAAALISPAIPFVGSVAHPKFYTAGEADMPAVDLGNSAFGGRDRASGAENSAPEVTGGGRCEMLLVSSGADGQDGAALPTPPLTCQRGQ